ncbi:uncharacterized protein [Watersipora subatra]|uniref:uncharacterized protein n=1 Tax=Watersipora subatra TaxID=2589382 RepID=UPI00355ADB95
MKCLIILACLTTLTLSALLPETHLIAQDMCSSLPDLSFLGSKAATPEVKAKLLPHLITVCEIYNRRFKDEAGLVQKRNIIDGLFGKNSKIATLMKAAEALNKAKGVFDEVKKMAPTVHDALKGSIDDVHKSLQDIMDSIVNEFSGKTATTASY